MSSGSQFQGSLAVSLTFDGSQTPGNTSLCSRGVIRFSRHQTMSETLLRFFQSGKNPRALPFTSQVLNTSAT